MPCIYFMHFAQSAHDATSGCRDQFMSEILANNFPEQIEMETSSFLVVAVNVRHFRFVRLFWVRGPMNRPAVPSRRRTVAAWPPPRNRTCRVSLFVGRQPCDLFSSGGPGMSLGMAVRVMQTSSQWGGTIVEEELLCYKIYYLKFTGDGQK